MKKIINKTIDNKFSSIIMFFFGVVLQIITWVVGVPLAVFIMVEPFVSMPQLIVILLFISIAVFLIGIIISVFQLIKYQKKIYPIAGLIINSISIIIGLIF